MDERPDARGPLSRLTRELSRRRVFRVAIAYAAAAWIVVEVATTTFAPLGIPAIFETAVVIIALLGFPIAVALAWAFDITERGVERTSDVAVGAPVLTRATTRVLLACAAVIGIAVLAAGAWFAIQRAQIDVDAELVAVLPFRVSGADPSLAYLREGMVDLLTVRLGGIEGTRAMDARTVLASWRSAVRSQDEDLGPAAASDVGVTLGAGRVLLGQVVGTPGAVTVNAYVVDVVSGTRRDDVEVSGPVDSLPDLVDRLATQVLALEVGEDEQRLRFLMGPSLPAVRAYLEGRQLSRRGRYNEAIARFREAITFDSTFALAASEMGEAAGWVAGGSSSAYALAWAARDRLGPRDLALLDARLGPEYPEPASGRDFIEAAERAVRVAPDSPEAWFHLGDWLFHLGRAMDIPRWMERARDAFDRALELDPSFAGVIMHAAELAAVDRDTARVRELGSRFFQQDSIGETADYLRWLVASSVEDEPALARVHERLDSTASSIVRWMTAVTQAEQIGVRHFDVLLEALMQRPAYYMSQYGLLLNAGRPGRAGAVLDQALLTASPNAQRATRTRIIESALYGGADTLKAAAATEYLAVFVDEAAPPEGESGRVRYFNDLWTVTEWRLWHGDTTGAQRALRLLRDHDPADPPLLVAATEFWASLLEAMVAVLHDRPDADALLGALESQLADFPDDDVQGVEGALIVSRLLEARGEPARALDVIRRRPIWGIVTVFLSTRLREEGRLATMVGDTAAAIAAYSHYLAIRQDVEPEVQPEVDRIREQLRRLTGEGR